MLTTVRPLFVLLLLALGGWTTADHALASRGEEEDLGWMEDGLSDGERELLLSTHAYIIPEFSDGVEWLGNEQPTFEALRGRVVVLHTWDSSTQRGRAMTRRLSRLLRTHGDAVQLVSLHTPEDAESVVQKYSRHSGDLPVPSAIDTEGKYLDELGIYKKPRIVIVDRDGVIRYAGVSLHALREKVQETLDRERSDRAFDQLPARDTRVDDPNPQVVDPVEFPAHNRMQAGMANNMQGLAAPEVVVETYLQDGPPAIEGKVVMVEFWATWCGPCISGIPHLNELQAEFSEDLVIIGITAEEEDLVRRKMRDDQRLDFGYTVAIDTTRRVQRRVGNRGIPHCIVISADGIVRWQGHPGSLDSGTMREIVAASRALGIGMDSQRWVTPG